MSWIVRASPVIPALEEAFPDKPHEFTMGDKVRVLPWEGYLIGLTNGDVFNAGGPEGEIVTFGDNGGDNGATMKIKFSRLPCQSWLIYKNYVELI